MTKNTRKITAEEVEQAHKKAMSVANDLQDFLSNKEFCFLMESINSKSLPLPQLLIKDHCDPKEGKYPTRLVVPAVAFTDNFSKIGYMEIKKILDKNRINYGSKSNIQSVDLELWGVFAGGKTDIDRNVPLKGPIS